jgi:SAM-dependent methyltransferase
MPTLDQNRSTWDGTYNWKQAGDEWSTHFGGPEMQWYGSLLPRVHSFLPAEGILEIACGFGRWTRFLKDLCTRLYAIDLSNECVQATTVRFANDPRVSCHLTDGKSLAMIPDDSIDFVFSFDSLVHVDAGVLEAYISQFPRVLRKNGAAFIHHSNLGSYPAWQRNLLGRLDAFQARDPGVKAELVEDLAAAAGLQCIGQELHTWGTRLTLTDCMTLMVRSDDPRAARGNRKIENHAFGREIGYLKKLAQTYAIPTSDH